MQLGSWIGDLVQVIAFWSSWWREKFERGVVHCVELLHQRAILFGNQSQRLLPVEKK